MHFVSYCLRGRTANNMAIFNLNNQFKPAGDQPQAIEKLAVGLRQESKYQTLMGVTGSGKTFTMANVIAKFDMPALVVSHNKTPFQEFCIY